MYMHMHIAYVHVYYMVFIYRSYQMVMLTPISALPKTVVSIVRNLRVHFEKSCVN